MPYIAATSCSENLLHLAQISFITALLSAFCGAMFEFWGALFEFVAAEFSIFFLPITDNTYISNDNHSNRSYYVRLSWDIYKR